MKATRSPPSRRSARSVADEALALIEIDYEVLPHVIDVDEAMKPDAPLLFEDMITAASSQRRRSRRTSPSGTSSTRRRRGRASRQADEIVEK